MRDVEVQKQIAENKILIEKIRWEKKAEMENLRHEHILEEIEAMRKSKITKFVRQMKDE